ncbi:MAG: malto-oligosyltrehalose synthase [Candidatus Dormibacteraceae bacterium]
MDSADGGGAAAIVPSSTYRLQLHAGFTFDAAAAVAGYLSALGVSHAYSSPYLQAVTGSSHGYDVVDHGRVNDELGGAQAHARYCRALREARLGQVLDIVPNHMSIASRDNAWWWELLKGGRSTAAARYFDIDWESPEAKLRDKILMPILADHYGRVLAAGDLRTEREETGELVLRYFEWTLPLDPGSVPADADPSALNGDPERLHQVLDQQHYRLAFWRTAGRELDYRRFFDINSLAALRVEDEAVFLATHGLVLRWLNSGVIDGVRVDHPDGLRDPRQYMERLREAAPTSWIVVEKILAPTEDLPADWPVAGTTGYEFLNRLTQLYVDPAGEEPLTRFYSEFTGLTHSFAEVAHEKKLLVLEQTLASDLRRLTAAFVQVCEDNRHYRDHTRRDLSLVLAEMIACLPVYRTYVRPGDTPSAADAARIQAAAGAARERRPDLDPDLFRFLAGILLQRHTGPAEAELVARFQQTTGAVTAKGVEDTAFYCYNRLTCLNEVGGDPAAFGLAPAAFHAAAAATAAAWPGTMLAGSTHDTKRSEDVRARLTLLSEIPGEWEAAVRRWAGINERHRRDGAPDRNTEYLFYQAVVGAHPLDAERAVAYLQKAAREAKVMTSWTDPDERFEAALRGFAGAVLADPAFTADLARFMESLIGPGRVNSLAWKLATLTAPGVPDIYQGTELWDLSLVDPDNRRPVDYALRRGLLGELDNLTAADAWRRADEGLPKLLVVQRALQVRRQRPDAFGPGARYDVLPVTGPRAEHAVAFLRGGQVATVVPRLVMRLGGDWLGTTISLPQGEWRNDLTGAALPGGEVEMGGLLAEFPVALLTRR